MNLKAKQGKVDIELKVVDKEEPREFEKFGNKGKVCNAIGEDATGQVKITLWNEQVDQINVGDTVKITNGYVGEWQGEKQLSTGRFGQMEVVGAGASTAAPQEKAPEPSTQEVQIDEDEII